MKWIAVCLVAIMLLLLSGCASEKTPAIHLHAAQWNASLLPLPLFENETAFSTSPNVPFVGFWVAVYTPLSGEMNCFIKEWYGPQNTFNRTAFLVPLEIDSRYQGDIISTGFLTRKVKPNQIYYQAACTRGNETFFANYTLAINYTPS